MKMDRQKITVRQIRYEVQKPKETESLLAWYFHRRISPFITWCLVRTPITPNMVTWSMLIIGIAGGILLSTKYIFLALMGALFFQLLYLLDCVDGELARITKKFSPVGEPLDHVIHYLTESCLYMGTGLGLFFRTGESYLLYVMMLLVVINLLHHTLIDVLYQLFPNSNALLKRHIQASPKGFVRKSIGFFSSTDSFYLMIIITLAFDLFFAPYPHPWGITTFYYCAFALVYTIKGILRIPIFYSLAKEAGTNK